MAEIELLAAVRLATGNEGFLNELRAILAQAESDTAERASSCEACGECCDFAARDHKLYVSVGELALLALLKAPHAPRRLRCPFQQEGICRAREFRPLGCRLFYCKFPVGSADTNTYEDYHQRIRDLHRRENVPYRYVELTEAMVEVS